MKDIKANDKIDVSGLDQLIRNGQLGLAREQLLGVSPSSVERDQVLEIANLARRLNMPRLMIRFLRPIVLSSFQLQKPATEQEIALYATALSRLGFFAEAEKLLKTLNPNRLPEVHLYHAMNDMFQWDYVSPIPRLKKYVKAKTISEYERLVGFVNMAASYIWNMDWKNGEAAVETIQTQIARSADPRSHRLILGYSFELLAEMAILQKDFEAGDSHLAQAKEILQGSKSRYEFFVRKWQTVSRVLKDTGTSENIELLHEVRDEAIKLKDWETYRDCEFYEAMALQNKKLFAKVYHGTPYESFRSRITKLFESDTSHIDKAVWQLMPATLNGNQQLEKDFIILDAMKFEELESKPLLGKLFLLLCRDYYRPLVFDSLIAQLYPEEYFNPDSSPKKAWQVVDRLRAWFKEQQLPLDIEIHEETCKLIALLPCEIPVQAIAELNSSEQRQLHQLAIHFQNRPFSSQDVSEFLALSKRSAQKLCQLGLQKKTFVQTSSGRATRYKVRKVMAPRAA